MIDIQILTETNYFLPEDGEVAKAKFLEIAALPSKGWYNAYGCNMQSFFNIIKELDDKSIPQSLLCDYLQSQGPSAKPLLIDFNNGKKVSSLVVTTAGCGSKRTSQIWHWKSMVKEAVDGGEPWCWEGSVNFSDSGWFQGNSARLFRSKAWADAFIAQHELHREWALTNEARYQSTISTIAAADFEPLSPHDEAVLIVQAELDKWQKVLDGLLSEEK